MTTMKMYKHVISLGFFCSVAKELERLGIRDCSSPFDWVLSDWEGVESSIRTGFRGFLAYNSLSQNKCNRLIYKNKIGIEFYHDFNKNIPLRKQFSSVAKKYERRIKRFYDNIAEPTLFIRYIRTIEEVKYLNNNYDAVIALLKKFNKENKIIFVANHEYKEEFNEVLRYKVFWIEKDVDDVVARSFLDKNIELKKYLEQSVIIPKKKNKPKRLVQKTYNRMRNKLYSYKGEYVHDKEY